jgi:flagellin-like hook-associated protein FlgL
MRANLLSLQQTTTLMASTQTKLSTGKKVNSATDNPTSYFAAQSLNSRATVLDGLKDAMGQAISTIDAANKGIESITSLIEQAKGLASQAESASITYDTAYVSLTTSATDGATPTTVTVNDGTTNVTLTAGVDFELGSSASETASNLAVAINNSTTLSDADYSAKVVGDKVYVSNSATDVDTAHLTGANDGVDHASTLGATGVDEVASLKTQYNKLISQLNSLALDSGYKGKNLLNGDSLDVKFESTNLTVNGFKATTTGALNISTATWTTQSDGANSVDQLETALSELNRQAASLSANLSIITTRSDFTAALKNTLNDGADKLTAADSNEEGANMLMLQTRQSLSTTALSLASTSAQSVLKLFQ